MKFAILQSSSSHCLTRNTGASCNTERAYIVLQGPVIVTVPTTLKLHFNPGFPMWCGGV